VPTQAQSYYAPIIPPFFRKPYAVLSGFACFTCLIVWMATFSPKWIYIWNPSSFKLCELIVEKVEWHDYAKSADPIKVHGKVDGTPVIASLVDLKRQHEIRSQTAAEKLLPRGTPVSIYWDGTPSHEKPALIQGRTPHALEVSYVHNKFLWVKAVMLVGVLQFLLIACLCWRQQPRVRPT
jgi:hypothetical protein